ncbi:MAG: hypothetical protein WD357_05805 [Gracilimonas sp.]
MITVNICGEEKPLQEINTEWISRIINRNRIQNKPICVNVNISATTVNLNLQTLNCKGYEKAIGGSDIENRVIHLWEELVLSQNDLSGAVLFDFLKRMEEWVSFVPKEA